MDNRSLSLDYDDSSLITKVTVPFREDMDFELVDAQEDCTHYNATNFLDHQLYSPVRSLIVSDKFIDLNDENQRVNGSLGSGSKKRKRKNVEFGENRIVERKEPGPETPSVYRVRGVENLAEAPTVIGIPFRFGHGITYSGDLSRLCLSWNMPPPVQFPAEMQAHDTPVNTMDSEDVNSDSPLYCAEEMGYLSSNDSCCDYEMLPSDGNSSARLAVKRKLEVYEEMQ